MSRGKARHSITQSASRLVGRQKEIALLADALEDALSGRARTLLISGEPGIGKTALAEEAGAAAARSGGLVLWGPCWGGEGAPAYWPWVQIIRSYARGRRTEELLDDMGSGAADIAKLVPEIGGRFLTLTAETDVDPEAARFRLFDHVARFLRAAAERAPLLLVFDDLHWADRSTLDLLQFVGQAIRDAPLLLLATYRDVEVAPDDPLSRTLGQLTADRIALHGLTRDEVGSLMLITTGAQPDAGLTDAVFGRTTGNPFFVREVAQLLAAQGRLDQGGTAASFVIPEGVRDVVRRRLARLPQDCVELLGAASVLGPEFDAGVLAELVDRPQANTLALLDQASSSRIIAPVTDSLARFTFAHALVREVIYDGLGSARRSMLHWNAGTLLSTRASGAHLAEIANHLVRGAASGNAAIAADTAVRAARQAVAMYAWDQAVELYERALEALAVAGTEGPVRVRTLLELGDAKTRAGDLTSARAAFEKAADLAGGLGLTTELAHAALGFGGGLGGFEVPLFDERQVELLHRALDALPAEDSAVRAWVLARLSVASSFVRGADERAGLSRQAVDMARRLGDRGALSYALSSLCDALADPDHLAERLAASTEMVALASQPATGAARCGVESCAVCLCDPEFSLLGRRLRLVANLERGDLAAAEEDIDAYARLAEHLRQPLYQWYVPLFEAMRAMMRGHLSEAERHLERTRAVGGRTSSVNAHVLISVQEAGLAMELGRPGEAQRAWNAAFASSSELAKHPSSSGVPVLMSGLFGDPRASVAALERWASKGGLSAQAKDAEWLSTAAYFADAAVRTGERQTAASVYDALAPYEELFVVEGIAARFMGSVAHYLGRLASLLKRFDAAERHFVRAIEAHGRMRAVLWEARSRLEYARMLALADDPRAGLRGSQARAAAEVFTDCGLEEAAADAAAAAEGAPPPTIEIAGATFRREGEYWTVAFDGSVARLKDSKGLRDIAELLAAPGKEIGALDLVARDAGRAASREAGVGREGDAGEVLDDRARAAYKARIADLQSEIEEAEADHDTARAERAREELDALTAQLAGAYGLGGRSRKAGDPAERARKAVTERIREALAKIATEHPALHRHLKASIRTGTFCSYEPERPVTWAF